MPTTAAEHTVDLPTLVKKQPFRRPWNNGVDECHGRVPLSGCRVKDAEPRLVRVVRILINVRKTPSRLARQSADRRIDNVDPYIRVFETPAVEVAARKVGEPNDVDAAERLDRPFPDATIKDDVASAPFGCYAAQGSVLRVGAEGPPGHSGSPKFV